MPHKSLLPFFILGLGFVWAALFEWMRRRSSATSDLKAPESNMPHLTLIGMGGLVLCMIAAGIAAYTKWL